MKIYVKNMVCDRCRFAVEGVLQTMGIPYESVSLGEADLGDLTLTGAQLSEFKGRIESLGFELISDRKSRLIDRVKTLVVELVQNPVEGEKTKLSDYLSERLFHDYTYLSNLFSSVEGVTIEHFFINQRIEKVKEYLVYDEMTLTEIAYLMGYSSVAHLSRQFKKQTGQTPSHFKSLRDSSQRRPLDKA